MVDTPSGTQRAARQYDGDDGNHRARNAERQRERRHNILSHDIVHRPFLDAV